MTGDTAHPSRASVPSQPDPVASLGEAIERGYADLRRGVEVLVWRTGLAGGQESVAGVADDVLQDVVVRALARAAVFDPTRSAHAWLFGIAVNVVRERRRQHLHDVQHRIPTDANPLDERSDLADREMSRAYGLMATSPESALLELLDLVSPNDQQVLRYAFVERLRGAELAGALGIKEGAARVRLSRALGRLAAAYRQAERAGGSGVDR